MVWSVGAHLVCLNRFELLGVARVSGAIYQESDDAEREYE